MQKNKIINNRVNNRVEKINIRVEKNLEVLKLLKNADANISAAEKTSILNEYTGWGGLSDAIYTPSIYKELKYYLNDDEINLIKKTTKSAYYTPKLLVKFIWSIIGIDDVIGV